jgi:hypothetical protein
MKPGILIPTAGMAWALLCTASLWAQPQPAGSYPSHILQGYGFISPGVYIGYSENVATLHAGLGVETFLTRGLAAGAEAGVLGAIRGSDPLGLLSLDGSYHFSRQRKIVPFLCAGYSLVGGDGWRNLVNLGGGINWWFRDRHGLRLEFRDHIYADGSSRHLIGFRIGYSFR